MGGQVVRLLKKVGTFEPAAVNEIRDSGAPPRGADGFNPPSMLGAHGLGPYLHNGSALTLAQVMELSISALIENERIGISRTQAREMFARGQHPQPAAP